MSIQTMHRIKAARVGVPPNGVVTNRTAVRRVGRRGRHRPNRPQRASGRDRRPRGR
jgi:hypothetical protein